MMDEMNINAKEKETEIVKLRMFLGDEKQKMAKMVREKSSY
jgi:hypothetical protein